MGILTFYLWSILKVNLSVIFVPVQIASPPGFVTHSGCGCITVSCTVIDGRILRCQSGKFHIGCAGGFVYSQCGLALELLIVVSTTIARINLSNPLKALSRPLLHPVHIVAGEGVARSLAGQLHWSPRLHQFSPRLLQLDLGVDTCGEKGKVDVIVTHVYGQTSSLLLWAPYL